MTHHACVCVCDCVPAGFLTVRHDVVMPTDVDAHWFDSDGALNRISAEKPHSFFFFPVFTVRGGSGEETQAAPRRVLLHPDLSDHSCSEEDAAHRPQHVHSRRPGAHFCSQETLQSCKLTGGKNPALQHIYL